MIRLGINGFGRIGRQVLKAVLERHPRSLRVVAVNDLFDVETNAHLFRYDTNYGRYPGEVRVRKDGFVIGGRTVKSLAFRDPAFEAYRHALPGLVLAETVAGFLFGAAARGR